MLEVEKLGTTADYVSQGCVFWPDDLNLPETGLNSIDKVD